MKTILLAFLFLALAQIGKTNLTPHYCPDCLMVGCIYEQIDQRYDQSKEDIIQSIYFVCKERGITDYKSISLIKANYNL